MLMKKYILILLLFLLIALTGCSSKDKNIAIINMGIKMNVPQNMVVVYTSQKTFDYNGLKIPSVSIDAISKDQKKVMNIKSFPFPPEDYIKQYRSAFKSENIVKIKYDYKKLKVKKDSIFDSIYESKAILKTDKGEKTSYVYLVSFKNKVGTIVIQFTGSKKDKIFKYVESITPIKMGNFEVKSTEKKQTYDNLKRILLENKIAIYVPSDYEVKNRISPVTRTYYISLFGSKNDAIYLCISEHKLIPLSKKHWSMTYAAEIVKVLDEKGNFIVHNINNSHLYYLNSCIKELKFNNKTIYVRIDYLDKNNDKEFFNQIVEGIKVV